MKYLAFIFSLSVLIGLSACQKTTDDTDATSYDYHAHIISPDGTDKMRGAVLPIKVEFESHAGEPVHHIQVRIYKKSDNTEVYKKPDMAHVHAMSGAYTFEDNLTLDAANGFADHGHYVLEAKVWGENMGEGEAIETVAFHVH